MRCSRPGSILARCLLVLALLGAPRLALGALPHDRTLHSRVLEANLIAVVRLHEAGKTPWPGGDLFRLEVREILFSGAPGLDLSQCLLDNAIPGASGIGTTLSAPTDVDVLLFAGLGLGGRLHLLRWCSNSIVPLRDRLTEVPGPGPEARELSRGEYLELVRRQIGRMQDFDDLREAHAGAIGSMHPFNWHDRPALLARLLATGDPRVPALAREMLAKGVETPELEVLHRYFAREPDGAGLPVLRARLEDLLARWRKGELGGTEEYASEWSVTENRPREERLLDIAWILLGAGDVGYLRERLLPAYRAGLLRAGPVLIGCGEAAALRSLVETARGGARADGEPDRRGEAFALLASCRERTAILAVIRLAFARESPEETRGLLEELREQGLGPGVSFQPGSMTRRKAPDDPAELRAAWLAWWRQVAPRLPAAFPEDALDAILGPDPAWRLPSGKDGEVR